jgi:hypothetical protein
MDPKKRMGFAYSFWHAIESALAVSNESAPLELLLFVSLYTEHLPQDFLEDYDGVVNDLRHAFRRRCAKSASITRAALLTTVRRVLTWYETEDLESLMNAADATMPYAAGATYDESTLFSPAGAFLRTLCLQHMCNVMSIRRALRTAVLKIIATPALAIHGGAVDSSGALPSPTKPKRRQSVAPGTGLGAAGRRPTVVGVASSVMASPQSDMIRFSDLFKAVSGVDPDKPKREVYSFLAKALGWDLERYGVLPLSSRPPTRTSVTSPQGGGEDTSSAPYADPTAASMAVLISEDLSEHVPSELEGEQQAALRRKALLTELNDRWLRKGDALAAVGRYCCRRLSLIAGFPTVRDLPTSVYGIEPTAAPVAPKVPVSNRQGANGGAGPGKRFPPVSGQRR